MDFTHRSAPADDAPPPQLNVASKSRQHTLCLGGASSAFSGLDEYGTYFRKHGIVNRRGIFRLQQSATEYIPDSGFQRPGYTRPDAIRRLWGLDEDGKWLAIAVKVHGIAGYKDRGSEELESVAIDEVSLEQMLDQTKAGPRDVWEELGSKIKRNAQYRYAWYTRAQKLADIVEIEALIVAQRSELH